MSYVFLRLMPRGYMTPYYVVISYQIIRHYIQEDSNHSYRRKSSNFVITNFVLWNVFLNISLNFMHIHGVNKLKQSSCAKYLRYVLYPVVTFVTYLIHFVRSKITSGSRVRQWATEGLVPSGSQSKRHFKYIVVWWKWPTWEWCGCLLL
jgi:hypothetical protein